MEKNTKISKLKQQRSINTKKKIIEVATSYFCKNGFYKASIRKLAKAANISIGSFYFYFKNMEELYMEVIRIQTDEFIYRLSSIVNMDEIFNKDKKKWLRIFMINLLEVHESQNIGKMHNQLKALYYENSRISCFKYEQEKKVFSFIINIFKNVFKNDLKVKNTEAAAVILNDLIVSVLDRITCEDNLENKEKILDECIEVMYKYLFL